MHMAYNTKTPSQSALETIAYCATYDKKKAQELMDYYTRV